MTNQDLLYFVGTTWGGDPQKLQEYHDWYSNEHLPMMLSMPGIRRGDRYTHAGGDKAPAPYLATYNFESIPAYENYKANPLRKFLKYAGWEKFPREGDFIAFCHVAFKRIARFDKDLSNDGGRNTERIIYVIGTNLTDPKREAEFNAWHNDCEVPVILQHPGVIKADRYENMDYWGSGAQPPKYLAIYEFENKQAFQDFEAGKAGRAVLDAKEGLSIELWQAYYQRLGTWYR